MLHLYHGQEELLKRQQMGRIAVFMIKGKKTIKNPLITEIASITGTNRPTASKIINDLKRDGHVEVHKKDIILIRDDFYNIKATKLN